MDFILLDTNFFRAATKSPGNRLMNKLVPSLENTCKIAFSRDGQTAFRISLFALLEALNIVPPKPPLGLIDVTGMPFPDVYKRLIGFAQEYFQKQPELQSDYLKQQDHKQRAYIDSGALPVYEACVTSVLNRPIDITLALATYLARDYFLKYPFKTEDLLAHMPSLCVMFFLDDPPLAPASRFRLSMRLYDSIRQKVESNAGDELAARALRIKTDRDFLDTEIVQDITFGYPFSGIRHRVVALTFDDAQVVGARALFHRQVGCTLATKFQTLATTNPQVASDISAFLAHPGGCVIQSNHDGEVIGFFDLSTN